MKIKKLRDVLDYRTKVHINHKHGIRIYSITDNNDRIVGSFVIDINCDEYGNEYFGSGHLQDLSLSKEYIGIGISKLVFQILLNESRKTGYQSINLSVQSDNTPAINLYISLGFRIENRIENKILMTLDM